MFQIKKIIAKYLTSKSNESWTKWRMDAVSPDPFNRLLKRQHDVIKWQLIIVHFTGIITTHSYDHHTLSWH